MTTQSPNFNAITNPEQAIEQFSGEQFIEWLMSYIPEEMGRWVALSELKTDPAKPEKLRKFMLQRFLAAEALVGQKEGEPGFLGFAIANLSEVPDPLAEGALDILNQRRELNNNRDSWLKLLAALQISPEEANRTEPKEAVRHYIAELSDLYSNSEWQVVAGAWAAYERIWGEESKVLLDLLSRNTPIATKDLEVLSAASQARSESGLSAGHILDKAVFDNESKDLVWQGVSRQMEASLALLAGLQKYLQN